MDKEKEDADEEEPFFIKEDNDEEDEDFCSGAVAAVDPESTARPRDGWIFLSSLIFAFNYKAEIPRYSSVYG